MCALRAALGQRYMACRFVNFATPTDAHRAALRAVSAYRERLEHHLSTGTNLLLIGPSGAGKDHLLAALAKWACFKHRRTVRWIEGPELYAAAREAIRGDLPEFVLIDDYSRPDVLVLSDPLPPRGQITDAQAELLWRIVHRRYKDLRPIWCSVNVSGEADAAARLAPQIVDRLVDGAVIVRCEWESYRRPVAGLGERDGQA
jgi:DNA replication protein DnaC